MILLKDTLNQDLKKSLQDIFVQVSDADKQTNTDMLFGWLEGEPAKLALFPAESGAVFVDFVSGKKNHRRQFGGGKGQPLARAIGIKAGKFPSVIDATAGFGGDAFVLASLGCRVTMVERSSIIASLLADALARAYKSADDEIIVNINNLSLINEDSTNFLLSKKPIVDVVYMDPMYPEKKKKAAPKKEMVALQNLVGADLDSEVLLAAALKIAKKRVVVKRPIKADIIKLEHGLKPSSSIKSPNTRYDIYSLL